MEGNSALSESSPRPFPFDMRGQFCEINTEEGTVFIEVHAAKYDDYQVQRLKQMDSLEQSVIGGYLALLKSGKIDFQNGYLYKLQVYKANPAIADPWEFNESITGYEEIGFASLSDLLKHCKEKFGVEKKDFVPIHETHIPN